MTVRYRCTNSECRTGGAWLHVSEVFTSDGIDSSWPGAMYHAHGGVQGTLLDPVEGLPTSFVYRPGSSPASTRPPCGPVVEIVGPARIRLRRTNGWRKPVGVITCTRPGKYGNPFPVNGEWMMWTAVGLGYTARPDGRRACAVALHRAWLTGEPMVLGPHAGEKFGGVLIFGDGTERSVTEHAHGIAPDWSVDHPAPTLPERPSLDELRGHDLACWCRLSDACHVDTLLELANR